MIMFRNLRCLHHTILIYIFIRNQNLTITPGKQLTIYILRKANKSSNTILVLFPTQNPNSFNAKFNVKHIYSQRKYLVATHKAIPQQKNGQIANTRRHFYPQSCLFPADTARSMRSNQSNITYIPFISIHTKPPSFL